MIGCPLLAQSERWLVFDCIMKSAPRGFDVANTQVVKGDNALDPPSTDGSACSVSDLISFKIDVLRICSKRARALATVAPSITL